MEVEGRRWGRSLFAVCVVVLLLLRVVSFAARARERGEERERGASRRVSEFRSLKHCKPSNDGHSVGVLVSNSRSVILIFDFVFEVSKREPQSSNFKFGGQLFVWGRRFELKQRDFEIRFRV